MINSIGGIFLVTRLYQYAGNFLAVVEERKKLYKCFAKYFVCLTFFFVSQSVSANKLVKPEAFYFTLPPQRADRSLTYVADTADITLIFPYDKLKLITANPIEGKYSAKAALEQLMENTGYKIISVVSDGRLSFTIAKRSSGGVKIMYKLNKIAATVMGMVAASSIASTAVAQETQSTETSEAVLEELVVMGIRGSLKRAADIKKDSDAFVDAISSEGIGDFPDTNLAEALQRVAGVSIDRSGGEGEFVSVRGFGPEFNTVLFNGRQMPTTNGGRDFSFDTVASEMVNTLKVYKTSPVALQSGGIGSTIDIQTAKPLENPGREIGYSVNALYEASSGETTPRLFGSYSNTFADDTFGVYVAATHQKREAQIEEARTEGWILQTVGDGLAQNQFATPVAPGTSVAVPSNFDHWVNNEERERTGANVVLQWQASDELRFTLDGLYSKLDVEAQADSLAQWFGAIGVFQDIQLDSNNTVTSFTRNGARTDFVQRTFNRPDETQAIGFNMDWDLTDNLNMEFDLSSASAESDNGGNDLFAVTGYDQPVNFALQGNGLVPAVTGYTPDLGTNFDPIRLHVALRQAVQADPNGGSYKDDVDEARLNFKWDSSGDGALTQVKGGILASNREKDNKQFATPTPIRIFYRGYFQDAPQSLFNTVDAGSFLSGSGGSALPSSYPGFSGEELVSYLESPEALAARDRALGLAPGTSQADFIANGGSYGAQETGASFNVEEEVTELYFDTKFEGELNGNPWLLTAGLRYSSTDVTATGSQQVLLDLQSNGSGSILSQAVGPNPAVRRVENDYDEVLPNLTFRYDLSDNLVGRFAYTHTLTRPSPLDLAPRISLGTVRENLRTANGGNPLLEPFLSKNIDLSLEWYPSDDTSLSAAYFRKDTEGLIVNGTNSFDLLPGNAFGQFQVSQPVNGEDVVIDGFEISANHAFASLPEPFNGLGVQFNATFVSADQEYSLNEFLNTGSSFGVPGISDTMNLVVYYDRGPFEARVAWNQRDAFLQELSNTPGGLPAFIEEYEQIDAQVSYDVSDTMQVYVEAINLGNDVVERFAAQRNQFLGISETGPRYAIGVRGSF